MGIKLEKYQIEKLDLIISLINKFKSANSSEEKDVLIRMIAKEHIVTKGYLSPVSMKNMEQEDIDYVKNIDLEITTILMPIYNGLVAMATDHCKKFYTQLTLKKGGRPFFPKYQEKLIRWLLNAIIKHEIPKTVYTLLVSRSAGKTFSLSLVGWFLMLFHDRYVIHNGYGDYIELCSAPQATQLDGFIKNYLEFSELCLSSDNEVGLIGRNQGDESLLGIYLKYQSQSKIELVRENGGSFSMVYFILGTKGAEGKHGNLHMNDEGKFLSKNILHRSLIPTVGNRVGIFLMLSSAHHEYSEYQATIERNIKNDIKDYEDYDIPFEYVTWSGNKPSVDRLDDIKSFNGRRHLQVHWESDGIIMENQGYALAVERELEAVGGSRDDPSFATQYDNRFLSHKTSTFFDIKELHNNYTKMFEYDNIQKYLNDPKYTIIAGLDPAVTGDNSLLFIKALESGFGEDRITKIIAIYMLNPMKDKNLESILSQSKSVAQLIEQYDIKSLVVDESGVGKSMTNYIKDELRRMRYYRIDYKNIVEYVITSGNRNTLLEYYYNRIQSGLEKFFGYSKEMLEEENLKKLYVNALKSNSEKALEIITLYEHVKFVRTVYKDEKTNQVKVEYRQAELNFLHDDSIFSSALCSHILSINPTLTNLGNKPSVSKNTAMGSSRFNKR